MKRLLISLLVAAVLSAGQPEPSKPKRSKAGAIAMLVTGSALIAGGAYFAFTSGQNTPVPAYSPALGTVITTQISVRNDQRLYGGLAAGGTGIVLDIWAIRKLMKK